MKPRWYQQESVTAMQAATDHSVVVSPTGSGKSLILSMFCKNRKGNVLVLSHVKEIVEQNIKTLGQHGVQQLGMYGAGLGVKHINRVTVGSIQSVHRNIGKFHGFDTILVDEAHMVNDEGMYADVISKLDAQTFGLTATPFRLKEGFIYGKGGMFDSKCYEAPIEKLIDEGYLCPLKTVGDKEEFNTEGIRTTGGDFNVGELGLAFNRKEITKRIVQSLIGYKDSYKHWLLFAIDIAHAEEIAKYLNMAGISTEAVHSKNPRDESIEKFKAGKLQALVNVNVLTVGFDYPKVDFIGVLRPTRSPVLHMQMLGRGMRVHPTKDHCLVKDFAGNLKRLGSVTNVQLTPEGKPQKGGKNLFMKECPDCQSIVHPQMRVCECGHKFKFRHNLVLESTKTEPQWYDVSSITYNIAPTRANVDAFMVIYRCGLQTFKEWVLLDHSGYAGYKAKYWVQNRWRVNEPAPVTVKQLYKVRTLLWKPEKIQVDSSGKYPKILRTN